MAIVQKVTNYTKEVRAEMGKVSWPTRLEIRQATVVVLIAVAILATFVFIVDRIFVSLLSLLFG